MVAAETPAGSRDLETDRPAHRPGSQSRGKALASFSFRPGFYTRKALSFPVDSRSQCPAASIHRWRAARRRAVPLFPERLMHYRQFH